MNRSEHHAKAEQLLEQAAHIGPDQISHSQLVAEAQVHATLALSAPAEEGPPLPGPSETSVTADIRGEDPRRSEGGDDVDAKPHQLHMPPGEANRDASPQHERSGPAGATGGPADTAWGRAAAPGKGPPVPVPPGGLGEKAAPVGGVHPPR